MKKLTNRELARAFGVSLTQIKRWAVICLGRDPEADQSKGIRREYTIDEAFMIYLFGEILVRRYHIGLKKAKVHMDQIMPVLKAEKLLPSNFNYESKLKCLQLLPLEIQLDSQKKIKHGDSWTWHMPFVTLTISLLDNDYLIERGFLHIGKSDIYGRHKAEIISIRKSYPSGFDWPFHWSGAQYVILLWVYLEGFMDIIKKGKK
jgi:hypothetical protein